MQPFTISDGKEDDIEKRVHIVEEGEGDKDEGDVERESWSGKLDFFLSALSYSGSVHFPTKTAIDSSISKRFNFVSLQLVWALCGDFRTYATKTAVVLF